MGHLTFHAFPSKGKERVTIDTEFGKNLVDRQKAWIIALKMGKPVTKYMKVCSLHFTEDDFFKGLKKKKYLKKIAVPHQNLPATRHPTKREVLKNITKRQLRGQRRHRNKENINSSTPECIIQAETVDDEGHTEQEVEAAEVLIGLLNNQPDYSGPKTIRDFEVQVNTPKRLTVCDLITTEKTLCSLTGINNFQLLNFMVDAVSKYHKDIRLHKLSIQERIIMTFVKLKCDISLAVLCLLFGVNGSNCKDYITRTIQILSQLLAPAIRFTSLDEIQKNMPTCFKNFQDTQIVLDCTEIYIQTPKCLCCRIKFYSHYKSAQTVKFMTGVTPGGLISFVSKGYGGRASDKSIFEQSEVVKKLSPGCAIMADKGFLIDTVCQEHRIKLYRPPFLRNKNQLSEEEATLNTQIAAARVHIERVNQRLKMFKILAGKLQWSFVCYIDDIFKVICAVTNLSSPVLANDKFLAN